MNTSVRSLLVVLCAAVLVAACASAPEQAGAPNIGARTVAADDIAWLNRVTWGASPSSAARVANEGRASYLATQLKPGADDGLPSAVAEQIVRMTITQKELTVLVRDLEQQRKDSDAVKDDEQKKAAQQAYQQEMNRVAREAAARFLLRAVYSQNQLKEHMTWFWMNHFTVFQGKSNIRALVGDYEESVIRRHALGNFRDLVIGSLRHPAMIRYLDNEQNAANRINENYARELMELHTLGVGDAYTQKDVQELARILTGVGVNLTDIAPKVRPELEKHYLRAGLFEFNPARHDFGDKQFLGSPLKGGRGFVEVEEAVDRLVRHPACGRFVSRRIAMYFVGDQPSQALVDAMAASFRASDGDIPAVLTTLFNSKEFAASLGTKFKDPMHYVVGAIRLAYDDKPILNPAPALGWLNRMGQQLYGRPTPDGYPLTMAAWSSSGQMATRFEIARAIGSGSAGLFKPEGPNTTDKPAFPRIANALYYQRLHARLAEPTRIALEQAVSQNDWNTLFLSSPEFMMR
jgi:uncharacterized protein (DUF1800 family)